MALLLSSSFSIWISEKNKVSNPGLSTVRCQSHARTWLVGAVRIRRSFTSKRKRDFYLHDKVSELFLFPAIGPLLLQGNVNNVSLTSVILFESSKFHRSVKNSLIIDRRNILVNRDRSIVNSALVKCAILKLFLFDISIPFHHTNFSETKLIDSTSCQFLNFVINI